MFIHLHWHSHYSLLDGLWTPAQIVERAKQLNMPAIAITDHWNGYWFIEFFEVAKKENIKPVLWVEMYITYDINVKNKYSKSFHLVLLAQNKIWYNNIIKLISIANIEGFYKKPRIDFNILKKYSDNIIALSACAWWEIPQMIIQNESIDKIKERIEFYKKLFNNKFYLEIQPREYDLYPTQEKINNTIIKLSEDTNTPIIATMDYHYPSIEDKKAHDVLICLQTWRKVFEENRMMYKWDYHICSEQEMKNKLKSLNISDNIIETAILNTEKIANMCKVDLQLHQLLFPKYKISQKYETLYKNKEK